MIVIDIFKSIDIIYNNVVRLTYTYTTTTLSCVAYISKNKHKSDLTEVSIKLQDDNLYLCLYPFNKSFIHFDKFINKFINQSDRDGYEPFKRIFYNSNFTLKKNIIYLNFYFIYMILKYYLHKKIGYSHGFINGIESYKIFNTMNLYKIVALII
jgi:hypothetical protein